MGLYIFVTSATVLVMKPLCLFRLLMYIAVLDISKKLGMLIMFNEQKNNLPSISISTKVKFQFLLPGIHFSSKYNTSQLWYLILIRNTQGNCKILHYYGNKAWRVTRYVLGGTSFAFGDAFNCAYKNKQYLQHFVKSHIPLKECTGSRSLFDIIFRGWTVSDKGQESDTDPTCQGYAKQKYLLWNFPEVEPVN